MCNQLIISTLKRTALSLLEKRMNECPLTPEEHEALLSAVGNLLNLGNEDTVVWVVNMLTEAI